MKRSFFKSLISLSAILLVLLGGYWLLNNHQYLIDLYAKSTTPSGSIAEIYADELDLTPSGELMLYGSYPQINDKQDFNENCRPMQNIVELGCYKSGLIDKIYVLDIAEPNLAKMKSVTMAHELLHAGFERLSYSDKQKVNNMIEDQLSALSSDKNLQERLQSYETSEPGSRNNELHSIFGTEYKNILPELEDYYRRYFKDRTKIVQWNTENQLYINNKEQILIAQKERIESLKSQLQSLESRMEKLKSSGKIEQYNALVPEQNALVEDLKNEIESYNSNVVVYNDIINSINSHTYSSFDANI